MPVGDGGIGAGGQENPYNLLQAQLDRHGNRRAGRGVLRASITRVDGDQGRRGRGRSGEGFKSGSGCWGEIRRQMNRV